MRVTKAQKLQQYKIGWRDGALGRDQDPPDEPDLLHAYQRGWNDGKRSRLCDTIHYCERIQFDPLMSVLMAPPVEGGR